jgi:hypothetical protein
LNTITLNLQAPSEWYADSGAGSHMTTDAGKLSTISSPSSFTPSSIIVGNGPLLPVTATGSHTFSFPHHNLVLNDVLVSPNIIKNLISIRGFTTDNDCSIEFDPFGLFVKDLQTKNVIARCNSSSDLYPFYPPTTSTSTFTPHPLRFGIDVSDILGVKLCPSSLAPVLSHVIKISTIYAMRANSVDTHGFLLDHLALGLFIILI